MRVPSIAYLWTAVLWTCVPAAAQFAEPIFARAAAPNPAGTVSLKLDFVTPVGRDSGVRAQAVPESRMEMGLGRGFEAVFQMPFLRVPEHNGSTVLAGGQFSLALQYLLAGSPAARYAISGSVRLELPSGDSTVVGNTTQVMPALLAEWRATPRLLFRSNLAWNTTISGSTGGFANFEHANAVVWLASRHFIPVVEFAGSTNTRNGNTELVVQPEVIVAEAGHLEVKAGFSVAVVPTLHYDIRSQLAWFWGKRE
jgi:hypothetical protein